MDRRELQKEIEILKRQNARLREENERLRTILKQLRWEMRMMKPMSDLELFERSFKDPALRAYLKKTGFFDRMNARRGKAHH